MAKAINASYPLDISPVEKLKMNELAYNTNILHLSNVVLKKVNDAKTTYMSWAKFNKLYLVTSFPSRIYLLESSNEPC